MVRGDGGLKQLWCKYIEKGETGSARRKKMFSSGFKLSTRLCIVRLYTGWSKGVALRKLPTFSSSPIAITPYTRWCGDIMSRRRKAAGRNPSRRRLLCKGCVEQNRSRVNWKWRGLMRIFETRLHRKDFCILYYYIILCCQPRITPTSPLPNRRHPITTTLTLLSSLKRTILVYKPISRSCRLSDLRHDIRYIIWVYNKRLFISINFYHDRFIESTRYMNSYYAISKLTFNRFSQFFFFFLSRAKTRISNIFLLF